MTSSFTARSRERLRAEIVAAAADEVVEKGWRGLRMQAIADRVGVSRSTLNNEFSSKDGLAQALVLATGLSYCELHEQVLAAADDPTSTIREAARRGLTYATTDERFKAVMTPDGSETFLPLYTKDASPLLQLFNSRLTAAWQARWPQLDPERIRIAIEAGTRLSISHVLLPDRDPEQVADDFAALFGPFITGG